MVREFFLALYTAEQHQDADQELPWESFPTLMTEQIQELSQPFTTRSVFDAFKTMAALKAPGPDGYHAYFFQCYWALVGASTCDTILNILGGGVIPEGLNDTFISLIPKINNPQTVTQFRLIGLCNVAYKLVTKCVV